MFRVYIVFCAAFLLSTVSYGQSEEISSAYILGRISELYQFDKEVTLRDQATQSEVKNKTFFANPEVQLGTGHVSSQGVTGRYSEWSISQSIEVSGQKSLLKDKAEVQKKLNRIDVIYEQRDFEVYALEMAFEIKSQTEHLKHLNERFQELESIKKYLKNKKFVSPKEKASQALLENTFDEILIKKNLIENSLESKNAELARLLQMNSKPPIVQWLSVDKMKSAIDKLPNVSETLKQHNQAKIEQLNLDTRSANREWIPDLQVSFSESREGIIGGNHNQTAAVGFQIPLFNQGVSMRSGTEARRQIEELHQQRNLRKASLSSESNRLDFKNRYDLLKKLENKIIKSKDKSFMATLESFKKGQIEAMLLLEIEKQAHWYHEQWMEELHKIHINFLSFYKSYPDQKNLAEVISE